MRKKEKDAERNKKIKEIEEAEKLSELKEYLLDKYETEAREKNSYEKTKSDREVQRVLELIEPIHVTQGIIKIINKVQKKIDALYHKFEKIIDKVSEKSKALENRRDIKTLYVTLYIFKPHHWNFFGKFVRDLDYSNKLFHTWQDQRSKNQKYFKDLFQKFDIPYDWTIPLVKQPCLTTCDCCNICRPIETNKK